MAIEISLKKGTANPTSGLTLAEPLFNSTNNTFWMGKGTGNTPVWLGAGICGASGGIAAGLTYQIPTLGAVKDYFIGVSGSFLPSTTGFVSSFNGATGAVTGVSSFNGLTGAVSFVNYVASFNGNTGAVQGVSAAAAGTGISISAATGAITITNTGVQSLTGTTNQITVSGSTGAVTLSLPNTITSSGNVLTIQSGNDIPASITLTGVLSAIPTQIPTTAVTGNLTVSSGFTASGVAQFASGVTFASITDHVGTARFDGAVVLRSTFSGTTAAFSRVILANAGISAAGATLSGTVTAPTPALGNNSTLVATTAFVQNEIVADTVTAFNGRTGSVQGVSAAVAGTGISVSGATGAVTITNIGVQSFNGLTGAVGGVTTSAANTFTALQSFNSGISASGGATFAGTVSSDTGYRISSSAFNTQTGTTYTFIAADNGEIVMFNNASAITVTVPAGLPVGFNCTAIQLGAGQVGFTAASGVTLNSYSSATKIAGQHGAATIIGYSTNIYNLSGTLTI